MKIGELARRAGCKVVTVRYYEKKGLMRKVARTQGNYRDYSEADVERLCFIRHCRKHGMSLEEVADLLTLGSQPGEHCMRVHKMIADHIVQIDAQLEDLKNLKESLESMLNKCVSQGSRCGILQELAHAGTCQYCHRSPTVDPD